MSDDDEKAIEKEFDEAVNMTARELEKWLETDESQAVGRRTSRPPGGATHS